MVEVIGDTWQEYILIIAINELMKSGSDSYDPIQFGHFFNQKIKLHIINEVTPELCQPILSSLIPNKNHRSEILTNRYFGVLNSQISGHAKQLLYMSSQQHSQRGQSW